MKLLCINEELAYKKIVSCANKAHIIHLGEYLERLNINGKEVIDSNIQLSLNVK
jgi:hypothetical protein